MAGLWGSMVSSEIHLSVSSTSFPLCGFCSQARYFTSSQKKDSSSFPIFPEVPQLGSNTYPSVPRARERACCRQPRWHPCSLSWLTLHHTGTAHLDSAAPWTQQPALLPGPLLLSPLPLTLFLQCLQGLLPTHVLLFTLGDFPDLITLLSSLLAVSPSEAYYCLMLCHKFMHVWIICLLPWETRRLTLQVYPALSTCLSSELMS